MKQQGLFDAATQLEDVSAATTGRVIDIRRFIIIRDERSRVVGRVDITGCWWCREDAICSVCDKKADKLRQSLIGINVPGMGKGRLLSS